MVISEFDSSCINKAIKLSLEAEQKKNLPIGTVISFKKKIIAEGKNSIWFPKISLSRHAEMEALRVVPEGLWEYSRDMTLCTTLEPCLMCLGAILLHQIGRVIFGSTDSFGGAGTVIGHMPTYFEEQFSKIEWIGPASPEECDPLFARIKSLERRRNLGIT